MKVQMVYEVQIISNEELTSKEFIDAYNEIKDLPFEKLQVIVEKCFKDTLKLKKDSVVNVRNVIFREVE